MKEPNTQNQIDDAHKQHKDGLITDSELQTQLDRIADKYQEWLKRNQ